MTPIFDTLAFSVRLRSAGLDVEIADAIAFALRDVLGGMPPEEPVPRTKPQIPARRCRFLCCN